MIVTLLLALATLGLVLVTLKSMVLSTRAWISVRSATWEGWNVTGKVARVNIVLQNTGRSPANELGTSADSDKRPQFNR